MPEICIFDPSSKYGNGIYSFMVPGSDSGVLVCEFGGETMEELKSQGRVSPEAFLCPWEEAEAHSLGLARQRYCKGPERVSRERWWELLEVMPPARWRSLPGGEIFMVAEPIASDLYRFGVRIGEEYFSIVEDCDIEDSRLIDLCKAEVPGQ